MGWENAEVMKLKNVGEFIELIDKNTVILSDNGIHDSITVDTFTTNYEQVASLFDYDYDVSGLLEDD